jgi:hypothetical protein
MIVKKRHDKTLLHLRWRTLEELLTKAVMVLPAPCSEALDYIDENEYELAWDALFDVGSTWHERITPRAGEFWRNMKLAAFVMEKPEKAFMAFEMGLASAEAT